MNVTPPGCSAVRCFLVRASDVSGDAFPPSNIPCMEGGVQSDEEERKGDRVASPCSVSSGQCFGRFAIPFGSFKLRA